MTGRESRPGKFGEAVAQHRNGEGELATLERCIRPGRYKGALLLCFYDEDSPVVAPMLLDSGTVTWLRDVVLVAADQNEGPETAP